MAGILAPLRNAIIFTFSITAVSSKGIWSEKGPGLGTIDFDVGN
jgi:hypothetical protein